MLKSHALFLAATLSCLVPLAPFVLEDDEASPPAASAADVASIDAILAAVYDVISGPAGEQRDWERFDSLFHPSARLVPVGRRSAEHPIDVFPMTPQEYRERSGPMFDGTGFFESEIARRVERYGHIAHVFSTYSSRHDPADAEPFARGINSIQLLWDEERWWVVSILWDAETYAQPLPSEYLPAEGDR